MKITTKTAHFTNPLYLESGRILEPYDITYETYGQMNEDKSNIIVICHALTGSHHAAGQYEGESKPGWWNALIGSQKAVDTDKYFVICTNVIGSCFGSSGPMSLVYPSMEPYRYKFPVLTIKDMVHAQNILYSSLGIYKVHAIIGGSMGGMQALQFGVDFPRFAKNIIMLASTSATRPWAIAFNKISQEAILKDPSFMGGYYNPEDIKENGLSGLSVARMAGHISFLSHDSMDKKFGREYTRTDGLYELFGQFQVERYLEYNAYNFSQRFDPLSYLYIIKAINIFDISRGYDSLEKALKSIRANIYLVSFESDMLFTPKEMLEIHHAMKRIGKEDQSNYLEVESDYGHDAFLVETEKFSSYIESALKGN